MARRELLAVLLSAAALGSLACREPKPIWSDEFDKPGLPDPAKWSYDVGGEGWGNQELQYYTESSTKNARVEGGKLIVEARKEDFGKNRFTSARLVSKNKGDWTYGLIKVRAKLPKGRGTWPAIWMLSTPVPNDPVGWPDRGEIDIMEHVGHDPGWVHASIHCKDFNWPMNTQKTAKLFIPDADSAFHEYSLLWRPERMEFFVDDKPVLTFPNDGKGFGSWPFDKPFHLLLNVAVGGMWGGQKGVDETVFPQRMEVDYVRVYRLP
ncbi:MAG TPA: glycoside hydrolase [Elusimicrobia bacterium]|nr:glycoside hydrolase [Elusimicrobiota bacterium]